MRFRLVSYAGTLYPCVLATAESSQRMAPGGGEGAGGDVGGSGGGGEGGG